MEGTPSQGPAVVPLTRKPHDFSAFNGLMIILEKWRTADHEDNILLSRNQIIEIIEGVKALRSR